MTDSYDIIRLSLLPRVGPTRGRALARRFSSYEELARASLRDLLRLEGFQETLARGVHATLRDEAHRAFCERTIERNRMLASRHDVELLPYFDPRYPQPLRRVYDAPLFLFCMGEVSAHDERAVAVVGTRAPSDYGRKAAALLAQELAEAGITTVSGLALGIDTVAHSVTMSYGGRTVAVLGSGLANVYPASNRHLASKVAEHGCVLSELPLDAQPDAAHFPRRNRIISGLSAATIIVESGVKGGAMITAELALDQNKDVYAVPGSIFNPKSAGPNLLLKKGVARPITNLQDLAEEVPMLFTARAASRTPVQMSISEQQLYDVLDEEPRHIDDLAQQLGMPTSDLLVTLLHMEFRGLARQHPGKYFTKGC